jgi:hypothetical protein
MKAFYSPTMWLVAVVAGAIVAVLSLSVFPHPTSSAWPGTVSQVLPTLLIALAVEGRLYPDPAKARVGDPFSILALSLTAVAEVIAISAAASDHAFQLGTAAVANAAVGSLTVAVILIPLIDPTPEGGVAERDGRVG